MITPDWRNFPPLEEHREMTICIAAVCKALDGDPLIAICSDWQFSSALGSAEIGFKQYFLEHNWACLYAGDVSAAKTLLVPLKRHFKEVPTIDETNILSVVRAALNERKRDLVGEFVQGEFSLSHDEFFKYGKDKLPESKFRQAVDHISN